MNRHGLILATLLTATPLLAAPAGAEAYRPGDGFQAGGVYFHVVSVSPAGAALFRTGERLPAADGLEEHPDCYRVGRAHYHQEACPVLQAHFARHGSTADGAQPAAAAGGPSYAGGSHPIDYLRGSYVEPERSNQWGYGLYYGPWLRAAALPGGFRGRPGFGFRGGRGAFGPGRVHGVIGPSSFGFTFRRW